jgi:hypothetical protein
MPMEKTFRELVLQLRALEESVKELGIVLNDRPTKGPDSAVTDAYDYAVDDAGGWLNEAIASAGEAQRAVSEQVDLNRARRSLAACQEKFRRVEEVFSGALFSYERLRELARFGRERRGEWPSWAAMVKLGIERCQKPADRVCDAIAECWQEIAEHAGSSISVQATNIGQITHPAEAAEARES